MTSVTSGVGAGGPAAPSPRTDPAGAGAPAGPVRKSHNRQGRAMQRTMLALVLPSIVMVGLINAYPLIYAALQSLRNGTLIAVGDFVGLSNYTSVLTSSAFWNAAVFTVVFSVVGVFGSWVVGLAMALLLRGRMPGRGVFKVLLLLPWIVPIVVSSTSWNWLVATPQSPVPVLYEHLGLTPPLFLANPTWAKAMVCIFKVWISFPFMMLMSSAALASVDETVYEAAKMDGANGRQQFLQITMPLIARSTYISWILMTIFCVNDFPTIFLLTGGGPVNATESLLVLSYRTVFADFQVGPGVAIAFLMTLVLILISVGLYRQIRKAAV